MVNLEGKAQYIYTMAEVKGSTFILQIEMYAIKQGSCLQKYNMFLLDNIALLKENRKRK